MDGSKRLGSSFIVGYNLQTWETTTSKNFENPFTEYDINAVLIFPNSKCDSIRVSSRNGTLAGETIKFNEAIICLSEESTSFVKVLFVSYSLK